MSKFLKIIVNLVVIAAIAVAAALLVPPFVGVDTVMNDNTETETNLPIGSVAYGRSTDVDDLEVGDRIIYSEGSSDYIYEITDMDASAVVYKVSDPYNNNSDTQNITIQKSIPKVAVVIPFIGYGAIALQSTEGLIIVGLGIVFLIILFILSEIWRKDKYEEDEEDEEEESEEDSQEDEEDEEDEEEEVLSRRERRRLKKEEKRRRKLAEKESREEEEGEEEETEEELPEIQDREDADPAEQSMSGEDLDKAVAEAMSSVAAGVSQISEPEQVPDATIVMPDLGKIDQENIPDEIQESSEENIQEENEEISEETESSEVTEEEKPDEETEPVEKEYYNQPVVKAVRRFFMYLDPSYDDHSFMNGHDIHTAPSYEDL